MVFRTLAFDLLAAGVVLSLASIVLAGISWAVLSLLTVSGSKRQLRQRARRPTPLPGWDLAEIDEALERVLAEERGALPSSQS